MDDVTRFRSAPIPEAYFRDLLKWREQALKFEATGQESDRPDHRLLFSGFPGWQIGITAKPELLGSPEAPFVRLTFDKPRGEGRTERDVDPETLFVLSVHCVA